MKKRETTETETALHPSDIRPLIHEIRGVQVILDRDLAFLYGVTTGNLNKAVKRNLERFPLDFMFRLTKEEGLIFQNGISKRGRGGSRFAPYAFTENGIAMLSSVLHSERAIEVNIRIMREFVVLRKTLASFSPMLARIETVERRPPTRPPARNLVTPQNGRARNPCAPPPYAPPGRATSMRSPQG